jgi:hypothetical protein
VRLAMPSRSVDDLWHGFVHTYDYAAFCDLVCGRFLHHQPESAMSPDQVEANRSDRLLLTLLFGPSGRQLRDAVTTSRRPPWYAYGSWQE